MKTFLYILGGVFLVGILVAATLYFTTPKKQPVPAEFSSYIGRWTNELGEYFVIFPDGTGDYKISSSNVTGGTVVFDANRNFKIAFGPFGKKFEVSEQPSSTGDKASMVVNGARYTKFSQETAEIQKLTAQKAAELSKSHLEVFNRSIQKNDINEFYNGLSSLWKKQATVEDIQKIYKTFFDKKIDLTPWINAFPAESTLKNMNNDVVQAENVIVTDEGTLKSQMEYLLVNGQFELVGFALSL